VSLRPPEKILVAPPAYGMYGVCAQVNDVGVVKVSLELAAEGGDGEERGRFRPHVDEVGCILLRYSSLVSMRLQPHMQVETGPSISG